MDLYSVFKPIVMCCQPQETSAMQQKSAEMPAGSNRAMDSAQAMKVM